MLERQNKTMNYKNRLSTLYGAPRLAVNTLALAVAAAWLCAPTMGHATDVVTNGQTNTSVTSSSNGATVIQIATTQSDGTSYNGFSVFNANNANGTVFNNSTQTTTSSAWGTISGNTSLALTGGAAQAATESWHLEGTIYQATSSATNLPNGLQMGQSFTVDYLIDGSAQSNGHWINNAVQQISINGVSSSASGHIAQGGLGLNVTPVNNTFGVNFVSFNAFNLMNAASPTISAHTLLTQYALSPATKSGDIRFDFNGPNYPSVWGRVNSFTQAVPEPSTGLLAALGLVGLITITRRNNAR
jgi:hypothetical protein